MHYAILMADREVDDVQPLLPADLQDAPAGAVPLTDRNDNVYVGRMVYHSDTWTAASVYLKRALEAGQLPDGTRFPERSLVAVELRARPWGDAPLKFA